MLMLLFIYHFYRYENCCGYGIVVTYLICNMTNFFLTSQLARQLARLFWIALTFPVLGDKPKLFHFQIKKCSGHFSRNNSQFSYPTVKMNRERLVTLTCHLTIDHSEIKPKNCYCFSQVGMNKLELCLLCESFPAIFSSNVFDFKNVFCF